MTTATTATTTDTNKQSQVRVLALEKKAEIRVYQVSLLIDIIDIACKRGAFTGEEMSKVGAVFDTLKNGLQTAYQIAENEFDASEEGMMGDEDRVVEDRVGEEDVSGDVSISDLSHRLDSL